jgi:hypothetical protein
MSKRIEWVFEYSAEEVLKGARTKLHHHRERSAYWESERALYEMQMKEKGITFRDYEVTGGHRVEAVVNDELGNRYAEARTKLSHHREKVDEYELWCRALEPLGMKTLELMVSDIRYFGL